MFKTNFILKGVRFLSYEALSLGTEFLSHTIYWVIPILLLLSISRGDSNSYTDYECYTITWVLSTSPKSMHIVVLNNTPFLIVVSIPLLEQYSYYVMIGLKIFNCRPKSNRNYLMC